MHKNLIGLRVFLVLLSVLFPIAATAQVLVVNESSANTGGAAALTLSWSHTVSAGNDRLLVVGLIVNLKPNPAPPVISSVTYNGTPLTYVQGTNAIKDSNTQHTNTIWRLVAPPVGTASIVVTISPNAEDMAAGAVTFTGVDQANPIGATGVARDQTATSSTPSVSVLSTTGNEVVIDSLGISDSPTTAPFLTLTPAAPQINHWDANTTASPASRNIVSWGSTQPGAEIPVVNSWDISLSGSPAGRIWSEVAVVVKPANPTITSSANQSFFVGDSVTNAAAITVTDNAGTPLIKAAKDIRIRIPSDFNMTWDTTVTSVMVTGTAAAKVASTPVYYESGHTLVVDVTTAFAAGDSITLTGMKFMNFTAASPPSNLILEVKNDGVITARDSRTITVLAPSISSAANQTFASGPGPVAASPITITDDTNAPTIRTVTNIRIVIPPDFNAVWDNGVTTVNITGTGAGKVQSPAGASPVTYENSNKTVVISVATDFAAGDQITVSGLRFVTLSSSASHRLRLQVKNDGVTQAFDDKFKVVDPPTLTSTPSQTFIVGDASTTASPMTVTDAAVPQITAANDIRLTIPNSLNMIWDTSITSPTITGSAAAKVSSTVSYENSGKIMVINVTTSFAGSDQITVTGAKFKTFTDFSAAISLQVDVNNDGLAEGVDSSTRAIDYREGLSSPADRTFYRQDPATTAGPFTINKGNLSIASNKDIRLIIPPAFNMVWDPLVTTVSHSGSAAGKVSTTVTYINARTVELDVTTSFATGDRIVVSGLKYKNFTAASAVTNLYMNIAAGTTADSTDDKTIRILAPRIVSAADQVFNVGQAATTISSISITNDPNVSLISAANDLRIRIPIGFNMQWDSSITTATITGGAAAKVSTAVTYEDSDKTLVIDVTSNFAVSDTITIAGLKYKNFTAISPTDTLDLEVFNDGVVRALDESTVTISASAVASISSAAAQNFAVGSPATAMSALTITDNATTPTITAANDVRIQIPATLNLTWDTSITTATITGTGSGKVSTTVSYEDGGRTLVLNVTSDFAAGEAITVSGLKYANFTAASSPDNKLLILAGAGQPAVNVDDKTLAVGQPTLVSAANQSFGFGDPPTTAQTIAVADDATVATITAANDIRIRIPTGFNMVWDSSITSATIGNGAASKVASGVTYEDSDHTLVLNVTTDFSAGDAITVSGLKFRDFTAASAADNLELAVAGAGAYVNALDSKTITVTATASPVTTPATGGSAISADTAATPPGTGAYTTLTGPSYQEGSPADVGTGTIVLNAPSGFQFDSSATVTVTVTGAGAGSDVVLASSTATVTSTAITVTVNSSSTGSRTSTLTWSGIKVRPTAGTPLASGNMFKTGTATLSNVDGTTNFGTLTEVPGAASKLSVQTQPSSTATAGVAFTVQPVLRIEDQFGNLVTGDSSTVVTAARNAGTGTLQGTLTATTSGGIVTFANLSHNVANTITLLFTSGSLTSATSGNIIVTPAAASKLAISPQPSATATAGVAFAQQPVVRVEDAFGNLITSDSTTVVTAARNAGSGTLQGTLIKTVSGGVATFTDLYHTVATTIDIQFTSSPVYTPATSISIVISPAAANKVVFVQQPSNAGLNATIVPAVTVQVRDVFNNNVSGVRSVNLTLSSGTGTLSGTLPQNSDANGLATFSDLSINVAGGKQLTATSSGLNPAISSTFTIVQTELIAATGGSAISADNTGGAWTTLTGPIYSEGVTGDAGAGTIILQAPTGFEFDTGGVAPTVLIERTSGTGGDGLNINNVASGTSAAMTSVTASQMTFTVTDASQGGVTCRMTWQNVRVRPTAGTPLASGNITKNASSTSTMVAVVNGTSNFGTLNEVAGAFSQLVFIQQPTDAASGATISPAVTARMKDQFGNNVTTAGVSVTASLFSGTGTLSGTLTRTTDGTGLVAFNDLSIDLAGAKVIRLTSGAITQDSSSFNVSNTIITPATGGTTISADTAATGGTGAYTSLTGPYYKEGNTGEAGVGLIILQAPSGFEFDTGGTAPTVKIDYVSGTGNNINNVASGTSVAMNSVTSTELTFEITSASTGDVINSLTWQNIRVRPTVGTPPASGHITKKTDGGTNSTLSGVTDNVTSLGPLTEVAGAATQLAMQIQPSATATAGVAFAQQPVIRIEDQFGNLVTTDNATQVTVARNTGAGTLQGTTTVTASGGLVTFTDLNHFVANTIDLQFTSGSLTSVTSGNIAVSPAAASQLAIQTQPSATATAGVAFAQQPVIRIEDQFGNLVTTDNTTAVTATRNAGSGTLQGTTTVTASGGLATFAGLYHTVANTITLDFTSVPALTSDTSGNIVVSAAAANKLVFVQQPTDSSVGIVLAPAVTVQLQDAFNNNVAESGRSVAMVLSSGTGSLSGTTPRLTDATGLATFNNLSLTTQGTKQITASSTGLTAAVSSSFTIYTATLTVATGGSAISADTAATGGTGAYTPLTGPIYEEGNSGHAGAGTIILNAPSGFEFDTGGAAPTVLIQRVSGSGGDVKNINGVPSGTSVAMTSVTASQLTFTVTSASSGSVACRLTWQNIRVRPAVGNPLASGNLTKTGASSMLTVQNGTTSFGTLTEVAGTATKLTVQTQPSSSASVNVSFAQQPVIRVEDQFGNLVTADSSTIVTAARGSGTGTLQGSTTATASGGLITFVNLAHDTVSTITIDFTAAGLTGVSSASIAVSTALLTASSGTNYWLAFPGNFNTYTRTLKLLITGARATSGTVSVPGLSFSTNFSLTAGSFTTVTVPNGASVDATDGVVDLGVNVTAADTVTVHGANLEQYTSDGYLAVPTNVLGMEYIVLGQKNGGAIQGSQLTVVASEDGTTVSITPSVTTGSRTAGVLYNVSLNQGQVYQLRNTVVTGNPDLSGTIITADKPVGVYGGHRAGNVPVTTAAADHLVEMLTPVEAWGKQFFTAPLKTRTGDTLRLVASVNGTTVTTNGVSIGAAMNRGEVREMIVTNTVEMVSSAPVQLAQYAQGAAYDRVTGDPFMMLVIPQEQYLADYRLTAPSGYANYVTLITPAAGVGNVTLDGVAVNATNFTAIGASGYSYARVSMSAGAHRLSGSVPFGAEAYGWKANESYGYPAGMNVAPVGGVAGFALGPTSANNPIGAQHCLTATVTNSSNVGLEGVRVDFSVTGNNTRTAFVFSDANGLASYCYTDTSGAVGTGDTITAQIGQATQTATATWGSSSAPTISGLSSVSVTLLPAEGSKLQALTAHIEDSDTGSVTVTWKVDGVVQRTMAVGSGIPVSADDTFSYDYAAGTHEVVVTANDGVNVSSLTITVTVLDVTAPTVTLLGANPLTNDLNVAYSEPGYSASDVAAGDLTGSVTVSGTVDVTTVGTYRLTYSVSDPSGNTGSATRTVRVVDPANPVITRADSSGTNYWLAFPGNFITYTRTLEVLITSAYSTFGTVSVPGLSFSTNFSVTAGGSTTVTVPNGASVDTLDGTVNLGVRVTAQDEVTVHGLNREQYTSDGYLGIPSDALGTEYIVLGQKNGGAYIQGSQLTVVASQDGTTVTITPSVTTGSRTAGTPYNESLNQGQVYQLRNPDSAGNPDLSGTIITADKPIGVYGGHKAGTVPVTTAAADHLVEMLTPVPAWGKLFFTAPLATRTGYTIRLVASVNGTLVTTNSVSIGAALNRGEVHEMIVTDAVEIVSSAPVQVAQYAHGAAYDSAAGDPFVLLVSPQEQYLADYRVTVPSGYTGYVTLISPTAWVGNVMTNGVAVGAGDFTAIGASGYAYARVGLSTGAHRLSGSVPLGAGVYGWKANESYGYPAGMNLATVATVDTVALAPATATKVNGTSHTVVATVTAGGSPVAGVRVDFTVTGRNSREGFAYTDAAGQASVTYTDTLGNGTDTITAIVGTVTGTATVTWGP